MAQMILPYKQKQIMDKESKHVLDGRGEEKKGMAGDSGVDGCGLLHLEAMGNGILLNSTGH